MTPGRDHGQTLVVGGYGYRNLGDEAILAGLLTTLDRERVTVVSRDPSGTARQHGVRSASRAAAVPALASHANVVIGGGGLFGRDMGAIGRLLPLFGEAAARLGRTVRLRGVGLDHDIADGEARLLRRLLRVADEVVVRDLESVDVAEQLGVDAALAPDLSTFLEPASSAAAVRALASAGVDLMRPVVVLALTDVNPRLGDRVERAVAIVAAARPDLEFVAIPMSRHPAVAAHDDRLIAERLIHRVPTVRLLELDDPALALGVFGRSAAVIGMRYHSLLFADRMGAPLVAIPYAEKCRHWLAERGHAAVVPDGAALFEALDRAVRFPTGAASSARQSAARPAVAGGWRPS